MDCEDCGAELIRVYDEPGIEWECPVCDLGEEYDPMWDDYVPDLDDE